MSWALVAGFVAITVVAISVMREDPYAKRRRGDGGDGPGGFFDGDGGGGGGCD